MSYVPLSSEQQKFATDHHGLVYKFLRENNLQENEFYDVVIFGYLRAVQRYLTEPKLKKFSFSTIGWNAMRCEFSNSKRAQNCLKRKVELLSINSEINADGYSLEDTIASPDSLMQQLETELLLHELAGKISIQQMEIVRLKSCGYNLREIAKKQNIPIHWIKEVLEDVHSILLEMCYQQ